jgi:hypothetical protein
LSWHNVFESIHDAVSNIFEKWLEEIGAIEIAVNWHIHD